MKMASRGKPSGYSGIAGAMAVMAGPPGSVTVPVESAVRVNVIMVRVESSDADEN
jgi:hypothetical protein